MPRNRRSTGLPNYLQRRGDKAREKQDWERARAYYTAALYLDPSSIPAKYGLADVEDSVGNFGVAVPLFQEIAALREAGLWGALSRVSLGYIFEEMGDSDRAFREFSSALEYEIPTDDPKQANWTFARALYALGGIETERGNISSAREFYSRAVEAWPELALAHANLAWCLQDLGNIGEAIKSLANALRYDPHHPDWFVWLGQLYELTEDYHIARLQYERALAMGSQDAQEALQKLPPETAEEWYRSGQRSEDLGWTDSARLSYTRALKLGDERARLALGRISRVR